MNHGTRSRIRLCPAGCYLFGNRLSGVLTEAWGRLVGKLRRRHERFVAIVGIPKKIVGIAVKTLRSADPTLVGTPDDGSHKFVGKFRNCRKIVRTRPARNTLLPSDVCNSWSHLLLIPRTQPVHDVHSPTREHMTHSPKAACRLLSLLPQPCAIAHPPKNSNDRRK